MFAYGFSVSCHPAISVCQNFSEAGLASVWFQSHKLWTRVVESIVFMGFYRKYNTLSGVLVDRSCWKLCIYGVSMENITLQVKFLWSALNTVKKNVVI